MEGVSVLSRCPVVHRHPPHWGCLSPHQLVCNGTPATPQMRSLCFVCVHVSVCGCTRVRASAQITLHFSGGFMGEVDLTPMSAAIVVASFYFSCMYIYIYIRTLFFLSV